jgi:hypothetical protein
MLDLALPRLSRAGRDWFTDSPLESNADPYVQYLLDRGYAAASIRSEPPDGVPQSRHRPRTALGRVLPVAAGREVVGRPGRNRLYAAKCGQLIGSIRRSKPVAGVTQLYTVRARFGPVGTREAPIAITNSPRMQAEGNCNATHASSPRIGPTRYPQAVGHGRCASVGEPRGLGNCR